MVEKKPEEAKQVLNQALKVLEHAMVIADSTGDIDAMIGISDRLMILYQHLSEDGVKRFKPGFALNKKEEVHDESD